MGEFVAKKNEFLVFEEGPTHDVVLQWATYYDAANQSALSRIWGGIHPPADDIPGRIIGQTIGKQAYDYGVSYFESSTPTEELDIFNDVAIFPNPIQNGNVLTIKHNDLQDLNSIQIMDLAGRNIFSRNKPNIIDDQWNMDISGLPSGTFILTLSFEKQVYSTKLIVINE
jgi:hypothetical protein